MEDMQEAQELREEQQEESAAEGCFAGMFQERNLFDLEKFVFVK